MKRTIIIAVEDPNILYLLQRYAEECGFRAIMARTATDLLDLAQCLNPALIILDGVQPESASQKHMLHALHTCAATHDVPVVLYSTVELPPQKWDARVAAYFPKSVRYDDFLAALQRIGVLE